MTRFMRHRKMTKTVVAALLAMVAMVGFAHFAPVLAQGPNTPPATMRAYAHIFIAYAAVWLLLFLWVLRIAGKLKKASLD